MKNKNRLIFNVGPHRYTVRVAPGPVAVEGIKTDAAWIEGERIILIEHDAPPKHRLSLVMWSLARAWTAHCGEPDTPRGWWDLSGTMLEQAYRDLQRQGGRRALSALKPSKPTDTAPEPEPISETEAAKRLL